MQDQPDQGSTLFPTALHAVPGWRLPPGVTRGMWEYAQAPHIALDYDKYFEGNSLFEFDEAFIAKHLPTPGWIADLGCGTGRALVPFARRGYRGLAIDLSSHMLGVVAHKKDVEQLPIDLLMANLTELDCVRDGTIDYAICMFSTLGMVRGSDNRLRMLAHVRRMLKPGGVLVVHVHNRWYNLSLREGRQWLFTNFVRWLWRRDTEPGDKFFDYRGIPQMYLHTFTRTELRGLIRQAGLEIVEMVALDTERRHALRYPWLLQKLRANGWIVACRRPID